MTHQDSRGLRARSPRHIAPARLSGILFALSLALSLPPGSSLAEGDGHDHGKSESHATDEHGHEAEGEGGHSDEASLSAEAVQLYGITLATAKRQELQSLLSVPARVVLNGDAMAHVGSPVEGRVAELKVRVGDSVKAGEVLAVIDSPALGEAQSDYLQKRSAVDVAQVTVEVARKSLDRAKDLGPGNGISMTEFQKREGELRLAEGSLIGAQAGAQAAENRLHVLGVTQDQAVDLSRTGEVSSRFALRAPIDGEVIEREITLGEVVGPDRESLMVIADLSTMWVLADVPEKEITRVSQGSPVQLSFGALPGLKFAGTVTYASPLLDSRTRKGTVRIEVSGEAVRSSPSAADAAHADHAHEDDTLKSAPPTGEAGHDDHGHEGEAHDGHDHGDVPTAAAQPGTGAAGVESHDGHDHGDTPHAETQGDGHGHGKDSPESMKSVGSAKLSGLLRGGMYGEAELALSPQPGSAPLYLIGVPTTAIQTVEGGPAVFVPVAGEPNTFAKRALSIGPRVGRWVPVLAGLAEGEQYVESGAFILKAELGKEGAAHEH